MQITNVSAATSVQYTSIAFDVFADFLDPHLDSPLKASSHLGAYIGSNTR